ncbi:MAG: hypothetical protein AB7K68_16795 [Bacteriovoracia bacterium]
MANVKKKQIDKASVEAAVEPELQTCVSIDAPTSYNEKEFATKEKTIHLQLDTGSLAPKKSESAPVLAAPEIEAPVTPAFNRTLAAAMPPTPERKPFWPVGLMALAVGAGLYFYHKRTAVPAAERAPASLTIIPAPEPLTDPGVHKSPVSSFMVPVKPEVAEESTMAIFVLKSDSDNFSVLVNGKDMPVISGKISLPLNQEFDLRFVRRGHKEIKVLTQTQKPGMQELWLKFEPLENTPVPPKL